MDTSQFTNSQPRFENIEQMETQGATCDTFRVKLYGKLHFLKRPKPKFDGDIRYQEAFRKEFETGYRLEHPNLVRYLSLDNDSILMEYVDGETLSQRLSYQPDYFKSRQNSDKFVRQLLDVVGYLHSHQVLHLDLKPDNILLTHINSDVKLIDLGFCYTDTFTDTQGHTDRFAAPEQLSAESHNPSPQTDIYALGKIIQLLPCHHKYNQVIKRSTHPDKTKRYQSIEEMLHDVNAGHRFKSLVAAFFAMMVVACFGIALAAHEAKSAPAVVDQMKNSQQTVTPDHFMEEPVNNNIVRSTSSPSQTSSLVTNHPDTMKKKQMGPVKSCYSDEEKKFMSDPSLRIVDAKEFERYKTALDNYFREVNTFLDDEDNLTRFPSGRLYQQEYNRIRRKALDKMEEDNWFWPLYNSSMNPVSKYTREYKSKMEYKAIVNANQLP